MLCLFAIFILFVYFWVMMQICLSFYEVKSKQPSWFTNKIERLYWEQWYVNLNVTQHPKPHSGKSHRSKMVADPGGRITHMPRTVNHVTGKVASFFFVLYIYFLLMLQRVHTRRGVFVEHHLKHLFMRFCSK